MVGGKKSNKEYGRETLVTNTDTANAALARRRAGNAIRKLLIKSKFWQDSFTKKVVNYQNLMISFELHKLP